MAEEPSEADQNQPQTITVEDRFIIQSLEGELMEARKRIVMLGALIGQQQEQIVQQAQVIQSQQQALEAEQATVVSFSDEKAVAAEKPKKSVRKKAANG